MDSVDLLIVEDDDQFRDAATQWMSRKGHRVRNAANGQEALLQLEQQQFDVVVVDMNMPGISGIELLQRIKDRGYDSEVLILTGQATVATAVEAMKLGAFDYLTKPFPLADLDQRIHMAADRLNLRKESRQWKAVAERARPAIRIVGESPPMREVFRLIERVGPTDKAVLIQGESGTGKELVARAIQRTSRRVDKPFVTINCAALPEQLVESELFGHEKGAFTGAVATKPGLFEVADGGTLFVDEIGELPGGLQPKLLRVLEDGSLRRVGSAQERHVNVRIIAATNRDLAAEVAAGRFREDLFYRINVLSLVLPPLREREGDVSLLIDQFLPPGWRIDDVARTRLVSHRWPGNVRQLANVIERATILADNQVITLADLPAEVTGQILISRDRAPATVSPSSFSGGTGALRPLDPVSGTASFTDSTASVAESTSRKLDGDEVSLEAVERAYVLDVLKKCRGNKAQAARTLGIHRRKLYRLLERFGEHIAEHAKAEGSA